VFLLLYPKLVVTSQLFEYVFKNQKKFRIGGKIWTEGIDLKGTCSSAFGLSWTDHTFNFFFFKVKKKTIYKFEFFMNISQKNFKLTSTAKWCWDWDYWDRWSVDYYRPKSSP